MNNVRNSLSLLKCQLFLQPNYPSGMSASSFRITSTWNVDNGDVQHARCCSDSARRSLPDVLDFFEDIFFVHATVGVLSEYMGKCLCLRDNSTTSSIIHNKSKADIYKSETDIVTFGLLCVISDEAPFLSPHNGL